MVHSQTWLITGASSGFGQAIGIAALAADQKVIGATRSVPKATTSNPEFEIRGGEWLELDPGASDTFKQFQRAQETYDIDVLVNSAGYAFIGGIEESSEEEIRAQMEINFHAPLRAIQALLPSLCSKRRGSIVLILSGAGFIARPGRGIYSASKFAIQAVHESLSHELSTLGIKVLIVEPGAFYTRFSTRLITPATCETTGGYSQGCRGTPPEDMMRLSHGITDVPPKELLKGDPDKAAKAIVEAVVEGHGYIHLILGPDCVKAAEDKIREYNGDLEWNRTITMGTDFDSTQR